MILPLGTSINALFTHKGDQVRDSGVSAVLEYKGHLVLMYCIYTEVLGSGFLLRPTFCIHAVVRAALPCAHEPRCP